MEIILSIDLGTTGLKVGLVNLAGKVEIINVGINVLLTNTIQLS